MTAQIINFVAARAKRDGDWAITESDYVFAAESIAADARRINTVITYEEAAEWLAELHDDGCALEEIDRLISEMRERAEAVRQQRRENGIRARARRHLLDCLRASVERG